MFGGGSTWGQNNNNQQQQQPQQGGLFGGGGGFGQQQQQQPQQTGMSFLEIRDVTPCTATELWSGELMNRIRKWWIRSTTCCYGRWIVWREYTADFNFWRRRYVCLTVCLNETYDQVDSELLLSLRVHLELRVRLSALLVKLLLELHQVS
jgi:hypothetical protein